MTHRSPPRASLSLASRDTLGGDARLPGTRILRRAHRVVAACFRPRAVPIIIVMTDVDQHDALACGCDDTTTAGFPSYAATVAQHAGSNVRTVGVAPGAGSRPILERLVADPTRVRGATGTAASHVFDATGGSGLSSVIVEHDRCAAVVPLDDLVVCSLNRPRVHSPSQ